MKGEGGRGGRGLAENMMHYIHNCLNNTAHNIPMIFIVNLSSRLVATSTGSVSFLKLIVEYPSGNTHQQKR